MVETLAILGIQQQLAPIIIPTVFVMETVERTEAVTVATSEVLVVAVPMESVAAK